MKQTEAFVEMTPAQYYALRWIAEHGDFVYPSHPDGWRRLGVPETHRKGFSIRTLRILEDAGYLHCSRSYTRDDPTTYTPTTKGKRALVTYEASYPALSSVDWYLQALGKVNERLGEKDRGVLRDVLKKLYDEVTGALP